MSHLIDPAKRQLGDFQISPIALGCWRLVAMPASQAQAVVEAAGGKVLNWETKQPLRYNTKDSLLNPYFVVCAAESEVWLNN